MRSSPVSAGAPRPAERSRPPHTEGGASEATPQAYGRPLSQHGRVRSRSQGKVCPAEGSAIKARVLCRVLTRQAPLQGHTLPTQGAHLQSQERAFVSIMLEKEVLVYGVHTLRTNWINKPPTFLEGKTQEAATFRGEEIGRHQNITFPASLSRPAQLKLMPTCKKLLALGLLKNDTRSTPCLGPTPNKLGYSTKHTQQSTYL